MGSAPGPDLLKRLLLEEQPFGKQPQGDQRIVSGHGQDAGGLEGGQASLVQLAEAETREGLQKGLLPPARLGGQLIQQAERPSLSGEGIGRLIEVVVSVEHLVPECHV